MSGLIFVQDAAATPLMPMAPAYARKLLHSAQAHTVPHHAFTIIRLVRPVVAPILHTIVLSVAVRDSSMLLTLLVQSKDVLVPRLTVVIDFVPLLRFTRWTYPRPHRQHWMADWPTGALVDLLARVIDALRLLTPISHLVTETGVPSALMHELAHHAACTGLRVVDRVAGALLPELQKPQVPLLCPIDDSTLPVGYARMMVWYGRALENQTMQPLRPAQLPLGLPAAMRTSKGNVIGIVARRRAGSVVLAVPEYRALQSLAWRRMAARADNLRLLDDDAVVFMPILSLGALDDLYGIGGRESRRLGDA